MYPRLHSFHAAQQRALVAHHSHPAQKYSAEQGCDVSKTLQRGIVIGTDLFFFLQQPAYSQECSSVPVRLRNGNAITPGESAMEAPSKKLEMDEPHCLRQSLTQTQDRNLQIPFSKARKTEILVSYSSRKKV